MYYAIHDGHDYLTTGFNATSKWETKEALLSHIKPNTRPEHFKEFCILRLEELCRVHNFTLEKSKVRFKTSEETQLEIEVAGWLYELYSKIGIDEPANHEKMLSFIANDVKETADPEQYHSGDFAIAFRRFIETAVEKEYRVES